VKDALQQRAKEAEEAGNFPLALELWKELAEKYNEAPPFLFYGQVAEKLAKWQEAEDAYTQALRLQPSSSIAQLVGSPLVNALLGNLWENRTDKDRATSLQTAREWYQKAVKMERCAPTLSLLGAACARLRDTDAATEAFEEALELDTNYDEAMYNIAVMIQKTNPTRARELLERAIQIDPDYMLAHLLLGRVCNRLKDTDRAESEFRRCLEIDPGEYWCHLFLAELLQTQKRDDEAEQLYKHAIELCPEEEAGLEFYARFLEKTGRAAEAAEERAKIKPSKREAARLA
jgi:tetratricopeptide (TPR) repeat protein